MSKKIILYRHGKSDWNADYNKDHDRPLAQRGIKYSKTMGFLLSKLNVHPDLILCSSALRAKQTLQYSAKAGNWRYPVEIDPQLYLCSTAYVLSTIVELPNTTDCVMLIGHEPSWSELCHTLCGEFNIKFPTAAVAMISFECETWKEISPNSGHLEVFLQAKLFLNLNTKF
jgi:phosphohistidine phosphatase